MILAWWANVLMVLLALDPAERQADEAERRRLRAHLATLPPEVALDLEAEPWRGVQRRGDFVQTLIAEAESTPGPGETQDTVTSIACASIKVLKEYGKKYPGTGVDDYLRRVAIDRSRPIPLRHDAAWALGSTIALRTTPFYIEVFRDYPELTTPLASILNSLSKEGSPLGKVEDLYTAELSEVMKAYYARRLSDPKVDPSQVEWGKRLVATLDRLLAERRSKGDAPKTTPAALPEPPPSPNAARPAGNAGGDPRTNGATSGEPGARSLGLGLLVVGITLVVLLWAILKRRARGGPSRP